MHISNVHANIQKQFQMTYCVCLELNYIPRMSRALLPIHACKISPCLEINMSDNSVKLVHFKTFPDILTYATQHMENMSCHGRSQGGVLGSWDPTNPVPLKIIKDKMCMHYACTAHLG